MTKKYILIPAVVLTFVGAAFWGFTTASAQETGSQKYPPIVQKIAEKFGLNVEEVNTVFNEHHKEHFVIMTDRLEDRLTKAVEDGKITEEQKQAILKKLGELHKEKEANFEHFKEMTPEERKETIQAHKQELKAWAEANGIDVQFLLPFGGKGMKVHFMH